VQYRQHSKVQVHCQQQQQPELLRRRATSQPAVEFDCDTVASQTPANKINIFKKQANKPNKTKLTAVHCHLSHQARKYYPNMKTDLKNANIRVYHSCRENIHSNYNY